MNTIHDRDDRVLREKKDDKNIVLGKKTAKEVKPR